jgi:hypothetical protein
LGKIEIRNSPFGKYSRSRGQRFHFMSGHAAPAYIPRFQVSLPGPYATIFQRETNHKHLERVSLHGQVTKTVEEETGLTR